MKEAVEMGERDPSYLFNFLELCKLTRYLQPQIKRAIENRRRQLRVQWSEINNVLDFRLKPNLKEALRNIEKHLKELDKDEERLLLEYTKD